MIDYRTVDAAGTRLACRVSGPPHARPLILLHALGEGAGTWDVVAPALACRSRVYAIDLRGHGQSDWPDAYSLELMKYDVLALLDALNLNKVDVIGHSMGGVVAYLLAEDQPRRVRRLILEDVPLPCPREPSVAVRPEGKLPFDWDLVSAIKRQIDQPDPRWLERLGQITARTLIVAGGPDSHVPQGGVAELARRIPDGRLLSLPVGHHVHRDAPEDFIRAVGVFLAKGDGGSAVVGV